MYSVHLSCTQHQGVCVQCYIYHALHIKECVYLPIFNIYYLFILFVCKVCSVRMFTCDMCTHLLFSVFHNFVVVIIVCRVFVYSVTSGEVTCTLDLPKTRCIRFSPRSSYLATWEPYAITKDTPQGTCNLKVWSGTELVMEYIQKKQDGW